MLVTKSIELTPEELTKAVADYIKSKDVDIGSRHELVLKKDYENLPLDLLDSINFEWYD